MAALVSAAGALRHPARCLLCQCITGSVPAADAPAKSSTKGSFDSCRQQLKVRIVQHAGFACLLSSLHCVCAVVERCLDKADRDPGGSHPGGARPAGSSIEGHLRSCVPASRLASGHIQGPSVLVSCIGSACPFLYVQAGSSKVPTDVQASAHGKSAETFWSCCAVPALALLPHDNTDNAPARRV